LRCLDTILIWWQHHRAWRELSYLLSLDDRTLVDIGVSHFQVKYEARKRFWQSPEAVAYLSRPSRASRQKEPCSASSSLTKPADRATGLDELKGLW